MPALPFLKEKSEEFILWKFKAYFVWKQTVTTTCIGILLRRRAGNSAKAFCLTLCLLLLCLNNLLPTFSYLFITIFMSSMATTVVFVGSFLGMISLWDIYLIFTSRVSWDSLRLNLSETKCNMSFVSCYSLIPKWSRPWHRTPSMAPGWATYKGLYHEHEKNFNRSQLSWTTDTEHSCWMANNTEIFSILGHFQWFQLTWS